MIFNYRNRIRVAKNFQVLDHSQNYRIFTVTNRLAFEIQQISFFDPVCRIRVALSVQQTQLQGRDTFRSRDVGPLM